MVALHAETRALRISLAKMQAMVGSPAVLSEDESSVQEDRQRGRASHEVRNDLSSSSECSSEYLSIMTGSDDHMAGMMDYDDEVRAGGRCCVWRIWEGGGGRRAQDLLT